MEATTRLTYRQGFLDGIRLLKEYSSGDGLRKEDELARLEKWAGDPENAADDQRLRGMGYSDGIFDFIRWLQGALNETPDKKDF